MAYERQGERVKEEHVGVTDPGSIIACIDHNSTRSSRHDDTASKMVGNREPWQSQARGRGQGNKWLARHQASVDWTWLGTQEVFICHDHNTYTLYTTQKTHGPCLLCFRLQHLGGGLFPSPTAVLASAACLVKGEEHNMLLA